MLKQQTPSRSFLKPSLIVGGLFVSIILIFIFIHSSSIDRLITWRLATYFHGYIFDKLDYKKGIIHIQGLRIPSKEASDFSIQSLTIPCHYKELWAGKCHKIVAHGLSLSVNVGADASVNFGQVEQLLSNKGPNLLTFDEWDVQEGNLNLISPWGHHPLNFAIQAQQTKETFYCTFQTAGSIEATGSFHKDLQMTKIAADIHKVAPFKSPFHLTLITDTNSQNLALDLELHELHTQQKILKAKGTLQPNAKKGSLSIEGRVSPLSNLLDISPALTYWHSSLLSLDGNVTIKGTLTWDGSWIHAQGPITLQCTQGNLVTSQGKVENFAGTIHFNHLNPFIVSQPQEIRAEKISLNFLLLSRAKMIFTFSPQGEFTPTLFSAQTLGGEITAHSFRSFKNLRDGPLCEVYFNNIHFEDLITLLAIKDLKISTTIQGRASLALEKEMLQLQSLEFYSTTPEGRFQYASTLFPSSSSNLQKNQLAFDVLRDLHFTRLEGKIYQESTGNFKAEVKLGGFNPEVLQGYPFEFNLTATGALKELIQNTLHNLQSPKELKDISHLMPKPENKKS